MGEESTPTWEFIKAACVPFDTGHRCGDLERAEALRRAHPAIASAEIFSAAVLGDEAAVEQFIRTNPQSATDKGGPYVWDPLTYLCFSRYLRLDSMRSEGFVRTARALLDAGASPNTGWYEPNHQPRPQWESVLYGAAGVAQHPALTQLLLDRGADPNDVESPYHVPETDDNTVLKILLACGRLNEDSLATMLLRKADWHDLDGIELLLEQGANPNRTTQWGFNALHQALRRDNAIANIELMLDFGADPALATRHDGHSAATIAARRGRRDVLGLFEARGIPDRLQGVDRLIAACARNEASRIQAITNAEPQLAGELIAQGGKLLAEFAANGNAAGVGLLLDLGVDVRAVFREGDGYWQIAENSTALHVAAWRAQHATVQFLIERGAPVNERDGQGRTPLALAVRACVDSHWTHRRSPQSVKILLEAGAVVDGVQVPSGYGEVDELLRRHAARQ